MASRPTTRGLALFALILAMHRIVADPAELRHSLGHSDSVAASDLVRLAKRIEGVRARATTGDFERLRRLPMPVMAKGTEGWFVIGRVGEDAVAIQRPGAEIERWDRADLEARWPGELLLVATRDSAQVAAPALYERGRVDQLHTLFSGGHAANGKASPSAFAGLVELVNGAACADIHFESAREAARLLRDWYDR